MRVRSEGTKGWLFLRSHGNSSRVFLIHIRLDVFLENNVLKIKNTSGWLVVETGESMDNLLKTLS